MAVFTWCWAGHDARIGALASQPGERKQNGRLFQAARAGILGVRRCLSMLRSNGLSCLSSPYDCEAVENPIATPR
jgi:hypothetical protein